jgi:hypothetical protein
MLGAAEVSKGAHYFLIASACSTDQHCMALGHGIRV